MRTLNRHKAWVLRLALAVAALVSGPDVLRAKDVVVHRDNGGLIALYLEKYRGMAERRDRLVIDGWCASSCTLGLGMVSVCVTPRAQLGFHTTSFGIFYIRLFYDAANTAILWNSYPGRVKKWITQHGGLRPNMLVMPNEVVRSMFPHCEDKEVQ